MEAWVWGVDGNGEWRAKLSFPKAVCLKFKKKQEILIGTCYLDIYREILEETTKAFRSPKGMTWECGRGSLFSLCALQFYF